ncbi:hypothetical protein [Rhizomonospora bruguierae]|uniref:hypothetical protein n=1 Tax=Rhizomonospora bruguierae TaxID=1581705 RepID=UPI001BCC3EA8|nr:hypothetical protein [Micromonospora sp. NBRC 107566]
MRDRVPDVVRQLADELASVDWLPPEELRRRARRRTRIGIGWGSATLAVLLIVAIGGPGLRRQTTGPQRYGTATAPATLLPDEQAIPGRSLLQPDDIAPGYLVDRTELWPNSAKGWALEWTECPGWAALSITGFRLHIALRRTYLTGPGGESLVQDVRLFLPGRAERMVPEAQRVANGCGTFDGHLPPDYTSVGWHTLAVLRTGFAGDESVLIRHGMRSEDANGMPTGPETVRLYAVVRRGDLVASLDLPGSLEDRAVAITRTAVTRMCAEATGC